MNLGNKYTVSYSIPVLLETYKNGEYDS